MFDVTSNGLARRAIALTAAVLFSAAALSIASAPPAAACCGDETGDHDYTELPDSARVQFRPPSGGTFYPKRLILLGPRAGLAAALPRRADLYEENRLPIGNLRGVGGLFQDRPLIDGIGPGTALGGLYRSGDALVAVFETEGAYRDALWRLSRPVGLVTRLSRGRGLASMRFKLEFQPISRRGVARGSLEGPIGVVHGADAVLALTPPRRSLPRNNIF